MRYLIAISITLFSGILFSQVSEAKVSIGKPHFKIGEQTTVDFEVSSRNASQAKGINFEKGIPLSNLNPDREDSIALEVVSVIADTFYHSLDVSKTYVSYLITAWDTGHFMIPPQVFRVNDEEIISNSIEFYIGTVVVDTSKDIKNIKDILSVAEINIDENKQEDKKSEISNWLWIGAGVLLLLIIIFLIWFILKKPKDNVGNVIELWPHEAALLRLEEIHKELNTGIDNKYYYSELTTVLRTYIEKRYYIPTLEKTSKQLLKSIRSKELSTQVYEDLKGLLLLADLVKFAKVKPNEEKNELNYIKAVSFVNNTKPRIVKDDL